MSVAPPRARAPLGRDGARLPGIPDDSNLAAIITGFDKNKRKLVSRQISNVE